MGLCSFISSTFCTSKPEIDTTSPQTADYLSHPTPATHGPISRPSLLSEKATGRTHVITELVCSERTYVNLLVEFEKVYIDPAYHPLTYSPHGKLGPKITLDTALTPEERKLMFKGHEEIVRLHGAFILPELEKATQDLFKAGDDTQGCRSAKAAMRISKVICAYAECFKMYSAYSAACDWATKRLGQWVDGRDLTKADKARVQAYLLQCKTNKAHSQIDMTGYLLLPVQRLTRYRMLLEHLESNTPAPPAGHRDFVGEALNRISTILLYVNEFKREVDSRRRLCHWADQIQLSHPSSTTNPSSLVQPHRILVREGPVNFIARGIMARHLDLEEELPGSPKRRGSQREEKVSRQVGAVDKHCMAVLCHDMLVLADKAEGDGWKGKLELVDVVRLSAMGKARVEHGNVVVFEAYEVTYYLQVDTTEIAKGWVEAINQYRWQ
ncbi:hypothetical protein L198_02968 [Cryptococcus wingfieldii CBS 7118]|uniref:DH domain-containing protein n=1 Tax=Cryptococcus wingfieldii CBS 7118 TaxID=1295528 RepID=A0A1E3JJ34_9TREE|nr:hypothetical protein L198_02968 [Cryptococcus wingfieldii CBS 7118]ODO00646.1 hypothetical protein L198_02968 [Cryptococcus wingfieldii CBS 7118]